MNEKLKGLIVLICFITVTSYQIIQGVDLTGTDTAKAQGIENEPINEEAVRIRIIPHSNAYQDQLAKRMVSFAIDEFLTQYEEELTDIQSTRQLIQEEIGHIDQRVEEVLETINYQLDFELTYGAHLFPEKVYNGEVFPEGYYESLVIRIGEGRGNNWWCFINPGTCLGPSLTEINETENWNSQYETTQNTQKAIKSQTFSSYVNQLVDYLVGTKSTSSGVRYTENNTKIDWFLYEDER